MAQKSLFTNPLVWLVGGIVVLGLFIMSSYNSLVNFEENVDNSFAKVETQYQRRFDLIPNLVSTVQGAAAFEQETFTAVTAARTQWQSAGSVNAKVEAANGFESALSRLLVTVEAYPQLQATQAFRDLMVQLEGTENRVAFARNEFNDSATSYNKVVRFFPRNLIAAAFGFDAEKALFAAAEGSEDAPTVNFTN